MPLGVARGLQWVEVHLHELECQVDCSARGFQIHAFVSECTLPFPGEKKTKKFFPGMEHPTPENETTSETPGYANVHTLVPF